MQKLLTAHELARELNLSVETVWRYSRENKIPVVVLDKKQYRYEKEAVVSALSRSSNFGKEEGLQSIKQGDYTYKDYLNLRNEPGYRYEILDGNLIKEPSPSFWHQKILFAFARKLADYFDDYDPSGELIIAPMDVTLSEKNVLQPDILYVSEKKKNIISEQRIHGPCDLIVEILSPQNRGKDRVEKLEIYRKGGVLHYWILDPEERFLEAFKLTEKRYTLMVARKKDEKFSHPDFPGLIIDLSEIF